MSADTSTLMLTDSISRILHANH